MCFDTAKSKISTNAAIPAKKYGFAKQKHIRGDKTLKIYNFGPNVVYIVLAVTVLTYWLSCRVTCCYF